MFDLKVAFIVGGLPFGGVENWLLDLCKALKGDTEVEPVVINLSGTGVLMDTYHEAGVDVISIGRNKSAINTHRLDTVVKLRRVLQALDVDVVHTLHFSGNFFGRLASLGLGIPVVVHLRNIKSEKKPRRIWFNRFLSRFTSRYLAVSEAVVETIQREHNVAGKPVQVLYNAVNPEKLDVDPFDLKRKYGLEGKVIIGVGRLVEQKNFDKLIKAFVKVRRQVPESSLIILGDGPLMEDLKQLCTELGLEKQVVLAGFQPNEDMARFLRASNVLAMPSDYEGLPVTHVEAMFCGLPAVISEHVPSKEIAGDSAMICTTDVDDIAGKLVAVLSDEERMRKMGAAATELAPEYSMQRYLEKLKDVYRSL